MSLELRKDGWTEDINGSTVGIEMIFKMSLAEMIQEDKGERRTSTEFWSSPTLRGWREVEEPAKEN